MGQRRKVFPIIDCTMDEGKRRPIAVNVLALLSPLFISIFVLGAAPDVLNSSVDPTSYVEAVERIGYGVVHGGVLDRPAIQTLGAGLFLDWGTAQAPRNLPGARYLQTIRVHQKLGCPLNSEHAWNREYCPYLQPHDYIVKPSLPELDTLVQANPGMTWLIGNEMDRRDWYRDGQDEMLPELYARAYGEIYSRIKAADPSARVGIGGVVQPTPLRLRYLDRVWQAYADRYGTSMPVDIWNVHNFVLREVHNDYGADIPPGMETDAADAQSYVSDWSHVDMTLFRQQIRAFRLWMAQKGQQEKPLLVSEYGVLYSHCAEWRWSGSEWVCDQNFDDPDLVIRFMLDSFDYFLHARDCSIGYQADDCRLVQWWLWFSLDHQTGFNSHAALYNRERDSLTDAGKAFRDWVAAHQAELAQPIPSGYREEVWLPAVARR